MKFKTKPGKKNRSKYLPKKTRSSKYLPKKTSEPKARKNPMTIKGYQVKERQYNRLTKRKASTLFQAAKLYGQRERLSREMEAWRNWRIPEIQKQLEELENKDRSRRRGANKNKWTETDLKKYAKLQEELKQIDPFSYASKRGMNLQFDEDSNVKEVGAMIQKYYEYVDKGIIKPREFIDNYDQANYMASIMTVPEIEEAIKQADTWKEKGLANQLKRQEESLKLFENFNF